MTIINVVIEEQSIAFMTAAFLNDVWIFLQIVTGYNLFLPVFLLLLYIVFRKTNSGDPAKSSKEYDYAIIVTAYEQTGFLPAVIASILKLNYNNYIVYIVADKCDVSALNLMMNGW